jgi:hypothetical protein
MSAGEPSSTPDDQRISAGLPCSDIPQDPRKSVVVRGDCHAVRHAPAHTTIMTVDGKLPCEPPTQLWSTWWPVAQVRWQRSSRPRRTAGPPAHPQQHAPGQARQPPQLISQLTVASLLTKAIDDGAGPVDQSPTAQLVQSAHYSVGTSRRDNSSTTTGDPGRITTRRWPAMP